MSPQAAASPPPSLPMVPGLVSVAMCVYNGQRDVGEAIESVLAQTYSPFELIVVDDGSTDATWSVLQSFGERIRTVRRQNGGLSVARNTALAEARGEFIALMDHDDICAPERLAVQVAFLRANPEVGLCCSDFSAFDSKGPIAPSFIGQYYSSCAPDQGGPGNCYPERGILDIRDCLPNRPSEPEPVKFCKGAVYDKIAHGNFAHPPTVMFRAAMLPQVGNFDPQARTVCDWDWLVRMARATHFGYIDRPLLAYRRSPTQMSSHKPRDTIDGLHVYRQICARDPALMARNRASLRKQLARAAIDAAYANAELYPGLAVRLLTEATLRYGVINGLTRRALTKVVLPNGLLEWIRRGRAINSEAR